MNQTHNIPGVHQLMAMQNIAARATLGGFNDSEYRSAYLPMKKPTKFIVTLKPVPKTENQINGTERSTSGCCCKYLPSSRLQIRASDALKGKPVLNAFRVLTNSKFISIDPTYNLNKDPLLSAALNNMRLSAGGLTKKKAKASESDSSKKSKTNANYKRSDASTSTHVVERCFTSIGDDTPPTEQKQKKRSFCCFGRSKNKNEPDAKEQNKPQKPVAPPPCMKDAEQQVDTFTQPFVDTAQQTEPPPEPAPPKPPCSGKASAPPPPPEPPCSGKASAPPPPEPPCSGKSSAPPPPEPPCSGKASSPPPQKPPCSGKASAKPPPEPPKQRNQQQQADVECVINLNDVASRIFETVTQNLQVPKPRLTFSEIMPKNEPETKPQRPKKMKSPPPLQSAEECFSIKPADVASRLLQSMTQTFFPPEACEQPPESVTEICKPRDIKTDSTGLLEPPTPNKYIEQQCSRMKQLEAQVEKLRRDLTRMKADFVPEKDMMRCTALTKKLQELNALLVEVKNKQLPSGLSSESTVAPKTEKLQNKQYYSDHVPLAKITVNSAVQVGCKPCQDNHSQTVSPTYACTGTGSSPVTTATSTARTTPRTTPRSTPRSSSTERPPPSRFRCCSRERHPKVSQSYCPFCERMEFLEPIVETDLFHNILERVCGRSTQDIVLAVVLQPNNVYHINISTISTGESLGCAYANEAAINEAHGDQLFEQFLTFFIVDACNSGAQKERALGHTFEFFKN